MLLLNSTNLGLHPAVPPTAKPLATGLATGYNGALATQVVPGLKASSPGLNIYYADIGALSNEIVANPASFGITNAAAPCYPFFSAPSAPICATPGTYAFWDELHPSAAVHAHHRSACGGGDRSLIDTCQRRAAPSGAVFI